MIEVGQIIGVEASIVKRRASLTIPNIYIVCVEDSCIVHVHACAVQSLVPLWCNGGPLVVGSNIQVCHKSKGGYFVRYCYLCKDTIASLLELADKLSQL